MRPSLDTQRGLPYRRRLFMARHRRRSIWLRLAKPLFGALLLVGSPAALLAWVLTSPEFALREISVETGERVDEVWAQQALSGLVGSSMFELSAPEIEWLLTDHPWIKNVSVRKRLPDQLHVEIEERQPVALLRREGALEFIDTEGEAFTRFDPTAGSTDLLLLSGTTDPAALLAAMDTARRFTELEPEWGGELSEVEVLNERDFRFYTAALPFPLVVSSDRLEKTLPELRTHLRSMREHLAGVGAIDLRFDRFIVVQPGKER
jgi:cell division septal protein FtsQ